LCDQKQLAEVRETNASMSVPAVWHSQVDSHQAHCGPTSKIPPVVGRCMLHAFESFKEPIKKAVSWHTKRRFIAIKEIALILRDLEVNSNL